MAISPKPLNPKFVNFNFTVINFDDVSDGTAIDSHYPGVTFASVTNSPNPWSTFARQTGDALTPHNVVSLRQTGDPSFDARDGAIEATFATPQRYVCINACPLIDTGPENDTTKLGRPYLQWFDSQGNYMETQYYPLTLGQMGYGDWRPLILQPGPKVIAKVRFSCHPSDPKMAPVYGLFDRLVFTDQIVPTLPFLLGVR